MVREKRYFYHHDYFSTKRFIVKNYIFMLLVNFEIQNLSTFKKRLQVYHCRHCREWLNG